jgi:hypothetical protein
VNNYWLDFTVNRPRQSLLLDLCSLLQLHWVLKIFIFGAITNFFEGSNPQLMAFKEMQQTFNNIDGASIIIAPETGYAYKAFHSLKKDAH